MSSDKLKVSEEKSKENHLEKDSKENESTGAFSLEALRHFFSGALTFTHEDENQEKVLDNLTFQDLMEHWKEKKCFKNIITMVGAGISTSAGIPDFRSPGSGLYHNLQKYELPHPTAIFTLDYFYENPKPFFFLAKELYPGKFKPTPCHYFVRLLEEKGLLLRHYTQNIDTLEKVAGIGDDKIIEAHGSFKTNHCTKCRKLFSMEWMKEQIFKDILPKCNICNGIVKPDIVFFGENLPDAFYKFSSQDFKKCDLLIIIGTSLAVEPFASLINKVNKKCIRLLINMEKVGKRDSLSTWNKFFSEGLLYDSDNNTRDIAWIGNCDDGVYNIADAIGFGDELRDLVKKEHAKIDSENMNVIKTDLEKV